MTRWILAVLLFGIPAFATSMSTFASQQGGAKLEQLIPGQLPMLTTTFAGTSFQSTFPSDLIFETKVGPIGAFTLAYTLNLGGQQFSMPTTTQMCSNAAGCSFDADFTVPTFFHLTAGTLTVKLNGSASTFGFMFQSPVQRQERLEAIQQELAQLAGLGRKVLSVEDMKEKHRYRVNLVKKAS